MPSDRRAVTAHPLTCPRRIRGVDGHPRRRRADETALTLDGKTLGLHTRTFSTSVGPIVVHAGLRVGETATLLLHGAAGSWTTWTPLLRAAADAGAPLVDVVAVDLPGWGESPFPDGGIDIGRIGAALEQVLGELGYNRWTLVGHSLGGFLALDMATRWPDRVASVLLVSPSGPAVVDASRHPLRGLRTLPGLVGMRVAMGFLAALGAGGMPLVRLLHRFGLLRMLAAPLFAESSRIHGSVIDALAAEIRPRSFVDAARAASRYDIRRWRAITCPVRAVSGERDVFVAPSDAARFAELIPDFTQTEMPAVGHFGAVERPAEVWRVVVSRVGV